MAKALLEDLNSSQLSATKLSDTDLSNLRTGRPLSAAREEEARRHLSGSLNLETREKIAKKLSIPKMFDCVTAGDLVELIRKSCAEHFSNPDVSILEPVKNDIFHDALSGPEKRTVIEIGQRIAKSKRPVLSWKRRFDIGSDYILSQIGYSSSIRKEFSKIVSIWPTSFDKPYQSELLEVSMLLGDGTRIPCNVQEIFDLFRSSNVFIVVNTAECLEIVPQNPRPSTCGNAMIALLDKAVTFSRGMSSSPSNILNPFILLSGTRSLFEVIKYKNGTFTDYRKEIKSFSNSIKSSLSLNESDRSEILRNSRKRYSLILGGYDAEENGPFARHAELTHDGNKRAENAPIHAKLRALATACHNNRSSFLDPTNGFEELIGGNYSIYEEIVSFKKEVRTHLDFLWIRNNRVKHSAKKRPLREFPEPPHLDLILPISTGLFWLSEHSLRAIQSGLKLVDNKDEDGAFGELLQLMGDNAFWVHAEPNIEHESADHQNTIRFFCSLGAKAIIQDLWTELASSERREAHYLVADYLKSIENNKGRLADEYPYAPHRGRSRIFFLGETIRYLIRSCNPLTKSELADNLNEYREFPLWEKNLADPLDAAHVVNYCFSTIYRQELNGDAPKDQKRNLSKRHGAFRYTIELLSLMSDGGRIGYPHRLLHPDLVSDFISECGLALLDVGDLDGALDCFERLAVEARDTGCLRKTESDLERSDDALLDELDAMLLGALVQFAQGKLDAVDERISFAQTAIDHWHSSRGRYQVEDGGPTRLVYREFKNRKRRIELRRSQVWFLRGDYQSAIDSLVDLENRELPDPTTEASGIEINKLIFSELPLARGSVQDQPYLEIMSAENAGSRDKLTPRKGSLDAEHLHLKIASLRRSASQLEDCKEKDARYQEAHRICLQAILRSSRQGSHHDEMGLRIALASLYRHRGLLDMAELILDEVHSDFLQFGGSERTFLAFLNEAGRILSASGREIHGYVTYLRPCMARAKTRGFRRELEKAASLSESLLGVMLDKARAAEADNIAAANWQTELKSALMDHFELLRRTTKNRFSKAVGDGPLFAYTLAETREHILGLKSSKGIRNELQWSREFLSADV